MNILAQNYRQLIEPTFPSGILEYFDLTNSTRNSEGINIFLEEKNIFPQEYKDQLLYSKGFLPEMQIQDFLIRGHTAILQSS